MSGVVKGIKKAVKSVGRFVKKYWKQIVIAAAVIFTAGIAAVGTAGFAAAASTAGGGFAGTMSAIGSTFSAGVAAIGGSVGIGQGVTAKTAGGAFADAAIVKGLGAGQGLTLGSGAAAQAMGLAPSTSGAAINAVGPSATAPSATQTFLGGNNLAQTTGEFGAFNPNVGAFAGGGGAAPQGGLMGFLNSPFGRTATGAGMNFISNYMQARALEDARKAEQPKGLWGVGLKKGVRSLTPGELSSSINPEQWGADSFASPYAGPIRRGGLMGGSPSATGSTGNRALDQGYVINPNLMNPLDRTFDPTSPYIEGLV